jgi:hypothetical protein
VHWRALVNTVMSFQAPQINTEFLEQLSDYRLFKACDMELLTGNTECEVVFVMECSK